MPSGEILDMVCNFDPTIRLEISREVWEIFQARHLGMEHSREIKTSLCFLPGGACGLWRQAIVDA